jgi:hypothetical protein
MNNFESICFYDSNSLSQFTNNFIVKENSLYNKSNNYIHKFTKILNNSKSMVYNQNIIKKIKGTSDYQNKISNTYLLYGNSFDSEYKLTTLLFEIINEFTIECFSFNFSLIEFNSSGVYNFISNNKLLFDNEYLLDFYKQNQYFDPIELGHQDKISGCKNKIETNLKNKIAKSFLVFTIENIFQKVRIYLFNELGLIVNKNFQLYSTPNRFLISELYNLTLYLLNEDNTKYSCVYKKNSLIKMLNDDLSKSTNFKVLFGFINNDRLLDFSDSFYHKFEEKNKKESKLVIYQNPNPIKIYNPTVNSVKPKIDISITNSGYKFKPIIQKPKELNKINSQLVKYTVPLNRYLPILSNTPTQKLTTNKTTNYKKPIKKKPTLHPIKEYKSETCTMELIKYVPEKMSPTEIFDKLQIMNKFLFNNCVKNQLKLQKAYKNPELIDQTNKDLIIHMSSLMVVLLDQVKLL